MADYNSSHVGNDIDNVVDAVQAAVAADGIVNVKGLNTILGNYLTSSSAANTYIPLKTISDTGVFLRGDNTWSSTLSSNLTIAGKLQIGGTTVGSLASLWGQTCVVGADGTDKAVIGYLASSTNGIVFGGHNSDFNAWAPVNLSGTVIYLRESERIAAKITNGCLSLFPGETTNWREGIRIHSATSGWTTLMLCGTDNTGDTGTSANSWSIHAYNGNFYITKNGSNTNTYFYNEGIWRFANLGIGGSYADSALQIFSTLSGGPSGWGGAPRLGFHWGGVTAAQLGVASNGYIYECPGTGTTFYQVQINTGSSRTIKHDIMPLPDMGDKIDLLQPVSFIYNDLPEEGTRYGLIHEDTVEIMPDICKFDENQNGGRTVNYIDLIPVLIKEIQSLRKRLKSLEDKNN